MDAEPALRPLSHDAQGACFLCAFSDIGCDVSSREGRLLAARERDPGAGWPTIALLDDTGERVEIELTPSQREVVRPLAALTEDERRRVRVRVFHLLRRHAASGAEQWQRMRATPVSVLVVEPDLLLNITDINNAEYCVRQYPLRRMVPSPPNAATLRGSIIHSAFKELLKGGTQTRGEELRRALHAYASELALRQLSPTEVAADAEPHMQALWSWYDRERESLWGHTGNVRAETFLLAPEVGLKGRLDFLLTEPSGERLLELKTSQASSQLPKREHRWQVHGYQTLLAARYPNGDHKAGAMILYSGTPGHAEGHGIPFILRDLHHVVALRNQLALVHALGTVPPPPAPNKCARCMIRSDCQRASDLLRWQPPELDERPEPPATEDAAWFAELYELMRLEGRAAEAEGRALWTRSPEDRLAEGVALGGLAQQGDPERTATGEWRYTFVCENTSELREGDAILLSDGDPVRGAVVSGMILRLHRHGVSVWTPERIERPALIDRYDSDLVHDRTVRNLWRWLAAEPRLRALVSGAREPEFALPVEPPDDLPAHLNVEQREAVIQALAARDYLLIQGPPGTGKTAVVSEIARRAVHRGERVLLAAFTNQAVDNALLRLVEDGARDFVRLGHELSVAPALREFRLSAGDLSEANADGDDAATRLREWLARAPLVAATAATWASDSYDAADEALRFDVAIIDEASQLTVPALLGPLRFARRFILVGDERQLPPLVLSEDAAERGLKRSLFARLLASHGERASVALRSQYRMHPAICAFPSQAFYGGELVAAGEAQDALLDIALDENNPHWDVLRPDHPLVFVDVAGGDERDQSGKVSAAQAQATRKLVRSLLALGVPAREIGVIAPFRAQVSAIRQQLERLAPEDTPEDTLEDTLDDTRVIVDTVDRFQGGERRVMLLSFGGRAVSQTRGLSFLADPNRLNVALTRAQRKLILIGERAWLRQEPLLARLIASCADLYGGSGGIVTARRARLPRRDG